MFPTVSIDYSYAYMILTNKTSYVTEVVQSSWGLSVTKIRCPVCRIYIPQSEWMKYVPASITELYNKFNQPFRSFSRCCSHCETEMAPCDFKRVCEKRSVNFYEI